MSWHTTTLARHQAQVDREAFNEGKLEALQEEVMLTAEDICDGLAGATGAQFMQFCELLTYTANNGIELDKLRNTIRLLCARAIGQKAQKALEEMQNELD